MQFDLSAAFHEAGAWILGALGLVASAWAVRRRISNDSLAVKQNDSGGELLDRYKRERDEAVARERDTAQREREQQKRMSALELRLAVMGEKFERQGREINRIKRLLRAERPDLAELLDSDFAPLMDTPPDEEGTAP